MATPERRSSRLRSQTPRKDSFTSRAPVSLSILVEREESPQQGTQANIDAITSPMPGTFPSAAPTPSRPPPLQTLPQSITSSTYDPIGPRKEEAYPKHHQGTEKKLESTKRLSNVTTKTAESSPNKRASQPVMSFSSPTFDFRCKRPSTDLSIDAQKIMDEVRDQAAKIKSQLEAQRDEQAKNDADAQALYVIGGRRIATPKGKVNRFSDVHMAQFKKMNSIADHASSFRANPSRLQPTANPIKRTNSKTNLVQAHSTPKRLTNVKRSYESNKEPADSPAKRFKQRHEETIASPPNPSTPTSLQRSKSGIPTPTHSISTPTLGSLARSNSVKTIHNTISKLPTTPTRTPPNKSLYAAKTDVGANNKFRNPFANKLSGMKSILRKPQLRFSDDPAKLAAGTHVSPQKQQDAKAQAPIDISSKKVYFSTSPEICARSARESLWSAHQSVAKKNLRAETPDATIPVTYPSLYPVPSISETSQQDTDSGFKSSEASSPAMQQCTRTITTTIPLAPPGSTGPGDFTFRFASPGTRDISFADPSHSIAAHLDKNTIRPASSSNTSTRVPPYAQLQPTAPHASNAMLPSGSAPHDLSNQKRKRETEGNTDRDNNKENTPMGDSAERDEDVSDGRTSKKARLMVDAMSVPSKIPASTKATGKLPTRAKKSAVSVPSSRAKAGKSSHVATVAGGGGARSKGILSMSRLNALARPKERK